MQAFMTNASVAAVMIIACTASAATPPDFNGDGFDDLAIPVPGESIGDAANAGAVNVIYGSANRLTGARNQIWHKNRPGVPGSATANDEFGFVVAWGHFNRDEFADLAIGAPGDCGVGAIYVLYGTSKGLTGDGSQRWRMGEGSVPGSQTLNSRFGASLTVGDFDNDSYDDLAIGAPGDTVSGKAQSGSVTILRGGFNGLRSVGAQRWTRDTAGIPGDATTGDAFGIALVFGDFNGDQRADLAIGASGEKIGTVESAGGVHVLYGSGIGLRSADNQWWHQDSTDIPETAEKNDAFGSALAAGDFDNDGFDDLAVGVPGERLGGDSSAGAVHVIYGTLNGLRAFDTQLWTQAKAGIADTPEPNDRFGAALVAGDFDGDWRDDLAIGVPGESYGSRTNAGCVHVIYGQVGGLSSNGAQLWNQNSNSVIDVLEKNDRFGSLLISADFDGNGRADLAIGVPGENIGDAANCGAVNVLYGSFGNGLTADADQFWHQNKGGIRDDCESGDSFGRGPN